MATPSKRPTSAFGLQVRKNVKVDVAGLRRTMAIWARAMKRSTEKMVVQQAGLLAQDMLNYTLPIDGQPGGRNGESLGARNVGIESMNKDIDHIFKPFEKASYADIANNNDYGVFAEYAAARKKAKLPIPEYVTKGMEGYFDSTKAWMRFRSAYGYGEGRKGGKAYFSTVNGDGMSEAHVARRGGTDVDDYGKNVSRGKDVYFADKRQIDRYKKKMELHVGRLKAAWYEVGMRLGRSMRGGGWIGANAGTGAAVLLDNSRNTATPVIWIGNRIQGRMTKSPGRDLWKTALNHRAYSMRNDVFHALLKAAKGSERTFLSMAERLDMFEPSKSD